MSARTRHMTTADARRTLAAGGAWVDLAEAIGVVISDPDSTLDDILLGLPHGGIVAEHAALALYKRTGEPLPEDRQRIRLTADEWAEQIKRLSRRVAT